jgi:hypothetical protein
MGPLDALWHLANLFAPAVLMGALSAVLAKALWRRDLRQVAWSRLALAACVAAALATVAGLVIFGRDGKMATYAAMVAASAITLWWQGFGRARR